MSIVKSYFGTTRNGDRASLYTITNKNGSYACVTDFGAILVKLLIPDRDGRKTDVVLGYDRLSDYEDNSCFFGAVIGRNANRIANASFTMDGREYHLPANENGNNLHTDLDHGFHKAMWKAKPDESSDSVRFSYRSPDGENGFPGNLDFSVTYTLWDNNSLELSYEGVCDKKTVINVTNHSYFNLGGHASGPITDEKLTLLADRFTEILPGAIPTGSNLPVRGTVMDFRKPMRIGEHIDDSFEQLKLVSGYDHNWVLDNTSGVVSKAAVVEDGRTGIHMDVYTDLPGIQFYAGNCIIPQTGKDNARYDRRHGLCLETQYFPDSVNQPGFAKPFFEAGQSFRSITVYSFSNIA